MRKAFALSIAAVLLLGASPVAAGAAPPTNDSFSSATPIAHLPFEDAFASNASATMEASEPDPSCGPVGSSVWYKIEPSSDYTLRVRVVSESQIDTIVTVYEGTSFDSLNERTCVNYGGPLYDELVTLDVQPGQSLYIQVAGDHDAATTGEFTVKARRLPGPANDNFGRAASVPLGSVSYANTTGATMQSGEWTHCSNTKTVWYRYTPVRTRTIIATTAGSNFDTVIGVYTGSSVASLALETCNDDRGPSSVTSKVMLTVQAGTTYYFQLGGFSFNSGQLVFRLKKA